ncbi:MAG: helix-turn-helix transcriptional regulator [Veillonella caviae]|uniref:helix-turn-helix domain-containing protein n=1 Tax=Veillonella caviae TaxID=248316 RepID=UPI002A90C3A8|nr:helix-turn-helix transcriptional regulator [Veillonella caviae]MDY5481950.1 helix-turn-helix transcriptional regulator [Veillonella caviae]
MARNQLSDFDKKLRQQISENLKKYTSHMTQSELSKLTGIPASTLSGYFAMRSTPNAGTVQKIADALNLQKSDLDPRFEDSSSTNFSSHTERDIQKRLQSILDDMNSDAGLAFYNGDEEMDEETKELLKISLETSIRTAKKLAQEKFTPKKYKNKQSE